METNLRPMKDAARKGSILVLTLILALIVVMSLAAAVSTTTSASRNAQFGLDHTAALSLAEGATNAAQKEMLTEVANFRTPSLSGTITVGGTVCPYQITAVGAPVTRMSTDGVSMLVQTYRISSIVNQGMARATVDRIVDLTMTPLFQYMIFYQDDLEILPGPSMTLGGRVHSNHDIYVGSGNTLTVDSEYFRCVGDILRRRKNDGTDTAGTISIKVQGESSYANMGANDDSENANWTSLALNTWKGTVQSGAHGVKEVAAPAIGTIKAFDEDGQKGYYHSNADLVVRDNQAYDKSGNPLSLPAGTITEKTMYDGREGKSIKVTEINIGLLNTSGQFPANGLIYAYRTDAASGQPNGIRLANGTEILRPMTMVSPDPVFMKGDFNTVNKKGAAVMCDAINLLSNGWNDGKTAGSLPNATATTYNMAIVTGNVPTPDGGGNYSGGFENLPRFHENWSNVKATIRGAFINIFESEIGKKPWIYGGDKYQAPLRDWQYDPALQNPSNLPPFTPNAVYFQRVLWDDRLPGRLP